MAEHIRQFKVTTMTRILGVARSGFYAWRTRQGIVSARAQMRHQLDVQVADNLLAQDFSTSAPNRKWAGDITYLWTDEGWLYLAVVLDLYSRRIIGWAMSERMTAQLVCDTLQMALERRQNPRGVIVHGQPVLLPGLSGVVECPRPALQHERQRQLL